jgi:hypothetical protein
MEGHFPVTVPPGVGPGSQLNVRAPTGETLTVVVPAGSYAGSQFMVPLRPVQAQVVQSPQPKVYQVNIESTSTRPAQPVYAEQVQSPRPVPPSSPAGTFPVIVPAGHFSGMRLSVRAPNTGEMMTVVIPAGVGPGGQFAVPLPMPVAPSFGTRSRPKGNAAARRQYQQARRRGDGRLHKVHWGVIAGISIVIILLIVLLTVGGDGGNQGSGHNTPGYCKESATPCMASWTDPTINGCGTPQEYCTNCDDSYHWCCTTNDCEGENQGWCRCNAGAPPKQAASGECLNLDRTCMASWTDASMGGTCGSQQTACSADSSGDACDGDSPWCCTDEACEVEGSGWCWCQP